MQDAIKYDAHSIADAMVKSHEAHQGNRDQIIAIINKLTEGKLQETLLHEQETVDVLLQQLASAKDPGQKEVLVQTLKKLIAKIKQFS
jgi:hypothetical protein